MSFRVAQVEDDNAGLQAEVAQLRKKIEALQEEKKVKSTSSAALQPCSPPASPAPLPCDLGAAVVPQSHLVPRGR